MGPAAVVVTAAGCGPRLFLGTRAGLGAGAVPAPPSEGAPAPVPMSALVPVPAPEAPPAPALVPATDAGRACGTRVVTRRGIVGAAGPGPPGTVGGNSRSGTAGAR
ncbi:hypothetical protein GCM10017687_78520 [Streptomyces echinatus]